MSFSIRVNRKDASSATVKLSAANPMMVKVSKKPVMYSAVRKKAQAVAPLSVTKAQGTKSFSVSKWNTSKAKKHFSVNKKNGKVTVKKGTPKGTYKFAVKVVAKGNANYKNKTVSKLVTIKVA